MLNFIAKVAQISHDLLGCLKHTNFEVKTAVATFGATFIKKLDNFIVTSGHTGN